MRDRETETIKKALKSLRSASQQFPPPNTQINKLKRLNFPLGKRNASKIRYRLLLNYNFLFRQRKQASQKVTLLTLKQYVIKPTFMKLGFLPKKKLQTFFILGDLVECTSCFRVNSRTTPWQSGAPVVRWEQEVEWVRRWCYFSKFAL